MALDIDRLIRRAQERDPEAFDTLVSAYGPRLYGYIYRLTGCRADSEELLQDLFAKVVRMIGHYEHTGRFEAWLFRIATNLVRDRTRRLISGPRWVPLDGNPERAAARGQDNDSPDRWVDLSATPPDAPLILREETDALQRGLAQLAPVEREVIMLRHFGDLSFAEIAAAMNTPLGTALARGHRALLKLRQIMENAT